MSTCRLFFFKMKRNILLQCKERPIPYSYSICMWVQKQYNDFVPWNFSSSKIRASILVGFQWKLDLQDLGAGNTIKFQCRKIRFMLSIYLDFMSWGIIILDICKLPFLQQSHRSPLFKCCSLNVTSLLSDMLLFCGGRPRPLNGKKQYDVLKAKPERHPLGKNSGSGSSCAYKLYFWHGMYPRVWFLSRGIIKCALLGNFKSLRNHP